MRLAILQKGSGLSQRALAREARLSLGVVGRVLTGPQKRKGPLDEDGRAAVQWSPNLATLVELARALGVPLADLFVEEPLHHRPAVHRVAVALQRLPDDAVAAVAKIVDAMVLLQDGARPRRTQLVNDKG